MIADHNSGHPEFDAMVMRLGGISVIGVGVLVAIKYFG